MREKAQLAGLLDQVGIAVDIRSAVLPPYVDLLTELTTRFLTRPREVGDALRYAEYLSGSNVVGETATVETCSPVVITASLPESRNDSPRASVAVLSCRGVYATCCTGSQHSQEARRAFQLALTLNPTIKQPQAFLSYYAQRSPRATATRASFTSPEPHQD